MKLRLQQNCFETALFQFHCNVRIKYRLIVFELKLDDEKDVVDLGVEVFLKLQHIIHAASA